MSNARRLVALVPAALAACVATTGTYDIGDRTLATELLPPEDQMFGGMETYVDENGEEQVLYWDGFRTIHPVVVTAADGAPLDRVADLPAAREAATRACMAGGHTGLVEEANVIFEEALDGTLTAIRFDGCALPEDEG